MLKLNQQRLNEVLDKAKQFETVLEVENDIAELLEAYKTISDAYDSLKAVFATSDYASIEGDKVKVSKYESGAKYVLADKQLCPPELMEVKLNPKAVDDFVKTQNVLPPGVSEKSRSTAVRITIK